MKVGDLVRYYRTPNGLSNVRGTLGFIVDTNAYGYTLWLFAENIKVFKADYNDMDLVNA